eukprot:7657751-Alexandrium_andersonii.AAC.1
MRTIGSLVELGPRPHTSGCGAKQLTLTKESGDPEGVPTHDLGRLTVAKADGRRGGQAGALAGRQWD